MKITVDDLIAINCKSKEALLGRMIVQDNVEMFKIYTCNMDDSFINRQNANTGLGFKSILTSVIKSGAKKMAIYLLAPVNYGYNSNCGVKNIKANEERISKSNYNYNFPTIDINSREFTYSSRFGQDTPLTLAAFYKHDDIVSLLLNHANMTKNGINQSDRNGNTPLHCAATFSIYIRSSATYDDAANVARILIDDKRTNVNAVDSIKGQTPLMYAIESQPKVARLLIESDKVDVNIQCNNGGTVLHVAAEILKDSDDYRNDDDTICQLIQQLLSRNDFDRNITNDDGKTGLDLAREAYLWQMINVLSGLGPSICYVIE